MIRPEHRHELAITLNQEFPLAIAAPDGKQPAPLRSSPAIARHSSLTTTTMPRSKGRSRATAQPSIRTALLSLMSASPVAMAACISLRGSNMCPAFEAASVSTDSFVVGLLYVHIH